MMTMNPVQSFFKQFYQWIPAMYTLVSKDNKDTHFHFQWTNKPLSILLHSKDTNTDAFSIQMQLSYEDSEIIYYSLPKEKTLLNDEIENLISIYKSHTIAPLFEKLTLNHYAIIYKEWYKLFEIFEPSYIEYCKYYDGSDGMSYRLPASFNMFHTLPSTEPTRLFHSNNVIFRRDFLNKLDKMKASLTTKCSDVEQFILNGMNVLNYLLPTTKTE